MYRICGVQSACHAMHYVLYLGCALYSAYLEVFVIAACSCGYISHRCVS